MCFFTTWFYFPTFWKIVENSVKLFKLQIAQKKVSLIDKNPQKLFGWKLNDTTLERSIEKSQLTG